MREENRATHQLKNNEKSTKKLQTRGKAFHAEWNVRLAGMLSGSQKRYTAIRT